MSDNLTAATARVEISGSHLKFYYNIPRTCLLNRLQVPAMVMKTKRSGLLWLQKAIDQACDVHLQKLVVG